MSKFQAGDAVVVISNFGNEEFFHVGSVGGVVRRRSGYGDYIVEFEDGSRWFVDEEDLDFTAIELRD